MPYDFAAIEKKWQEYWLFNKTFAALDPDQAGDMPKAYILDMFPYPSGSGLHVGHPEGYTATDIVSRFMRMKGVNVLHPMGWDAFGLPAEQHAIATGEHPAINTQNNIDNFRRQIRMLGLSYDWDREVNTTDPKYYKWTQWIFLRLFNSYFDPIRNKAMPIEHLVSELENETYVVAPDDTIHLNPTHEGEIIGDVRVERTWRELNIEERNDLIAGQRLAYREQVAVNWCPALGTVLSNEEVIDGVSERGGHPVERRPMLQWMLRITSYADRLLADLDGLDWPDSLKEMQRNWIGKSVGAEVDFEVDPTSIPKPDDENDLTITVFTTRPDTLYGATYMVLAPEHPLVDLIVSPEQKKAVVDYQAAVAARSERERIATAKQKTGVFTGAFAINPVNDDRIPIYIADYVLMTYGSGAIMAVPAHDERDWEFAKQFELAIRPVVKPLHGDAPTDRPFIGDGVAINSPAIYDLPTPAAKEKMISHLRGLSIGRASIKYKLRDWLFSRQRYWGEPFPLLIDEDGNVKAVGDDELPVALPPMADFKPTGTPQPPLSKAREWVEVKTEEGDFIRETNTMPQWAGSCWYYLRYIDPHNDERFVDPKKERYWMPVDLYVGGAEHAVLHLLYSRFWHKVLFDLGQVSTNEPFNKLVNQGTILGEMEFHCFIPPESKPVSLAELTDVAEEVVDGKTELVGMHKKTGEKIIGRRIPETDVEKRGDRFVLRADPGIVVDARSFKMSKSRDNAINPDPVVKEFGADSFRLYEMYMGPLEAQKPWNTRDIVGMSRFLSSVWRTFIGETAQVKDVPVPEDLNRQLNRTIKKVAEDIQNLRFNTAIAELIKLNNAIGEVVPRALAEKFALMLAPFAPHLAEEIWQSLGHEKSLARHPWPIYDPNLLVESTIELPVQVNGKVRGKFTIAADADEQAVFAAAEAVDKVQPWIAGKTGVNRRYIPGKLVSFVVKEK